MLAAAAALLLAAAPASAAGPRLLLDRAEIEPSSFPGLVRVRLYVTAIQLEGALIDVSSGEDFALSINGSRRREPHLTGRFAGTGTAAALVVVVETGWEMRDDVDAIREAVLALVGGVPAATRVAIMSYGESVEGGHKLSAPAGAQKAATELEADAAPSDPQLLAAVERAIGTLTRAPKSSRQREADETQAERRVIVVVSDGKDLDPDPARYRELGEQASRGGVRIHSLAYSPVDNRRPLLGLGELSKQSGGTFRWVRSREGFRSQVDTLVAELNQQYVLTWFMPASEVVNKRMAVSYRELTSNELRVKKAECGGRECQAGSVCARGRCVAWAGGGGRGILRWLLLVGGGLIGLVLLAGATGAVVSRLRRAPRAPKPAASRRSPAAPAAAAAAMLPPSVMPGAVPTLLVMSGPVPGQRLPLRHGFLVGSARGCDLHLPGDPLVAPHHAIFMTDAGGTWTIIDRGSAAGVFVNGVKIGESRLQHGNLVRFGGCEVRFLSQ